MAQTSLERVALERHLKAAHPHPQYLLREELGELGGAEVGSATPAAIAVDAPGTAGTSDEAARADHQHAAPGIATTASDGFMSRADKARLDALRSNDANDARMTRLDAGVVWDADNGTPVVDFTTGLPSQLLDSE